MALVIYPYYWMQSSSDNLVGFVMFCFEFLFQYGREGDGPGYLNHPYGVCTDMHGNILIADNWNHKVHLISGDGRFLRYLLTKDDGLHWPQALAIDKQGHLLVAELQGSVKVYQYLA